MYTVPYVFPYQLYHMSHSIYHKFTGNLITYILAYDYKNKKLHFLTPQSYKKKSIYNVYSFLFVALKDYIIFISPDNCSFNRTYSCTFISWLHYYVNTSDFLWRNATRETSDLSLFHLSYKPFKQNVYI